MKSALDALRPTRSCPFVRLLLAALFLTVFVLPEPCWAQGQTTADFETLRQRAQQLYDEHRLVEAMPLFEKLVAMKPESSVYHERLGFCILGYSGTLTDREAERKQRVRARQELLRSKELGGKSNLLLVLLEGLPEDGGRNEFSSRKEVDDAIREGEAAFGRGDMDAAAKAYRRALVLDPKSYEAALFLGDVYFKQKKWDAAGEWFAVAVQVNPDIETAHRYWGDALMSAGKMAEARARFIEAVIAAPYARTSWVGIVQWAQRQNLTLTHPRIESPNATKEEKGRTNITIDSDSLNAKDGRQHWMLYEMSRQAWKVATFKEKFPGEKEYRHTLQEEVESLGIVAQFVAEDVKKKKIKQLDPSLASLLKLHEAGLIEAYVLLAKPDAGIAKDYEAYRKENREKLRKYLDEWVVPKAN
jgi:tetratricopeptide (TPR) repeat protein